MAQVAEPFASGWRFLAVALLVGTVPFLLSAALRLPGHQWVSAILLAWLCLPLVRDDAWLKGIMAMGLAFLSHSVLVIAISHVDPERTELVLPGTADYWAKQQRWITTGEDPEYDATVWIPAHLKLVGAAILWDFSSLGVLTFHRGFFEVDLMNYYNAQLLGRSSNRPWALMLGWHIWSLLRGAGFLFVTFETCSLALQFWTQRAISPWRVRAWRWGAGLGFLLADAIVKACLLGPVRDQLYENLR